jgi:hypothetical protein
MFYSKAAGVYEDMLKTIHSLENHEKQSAWREFKQNCGTDLLPETLTMLRHVMLAQA